MIRKSIALLMALLFLWGGMCAAETDNGEFPALNDAGFLDSGEFVWEDGENGVWRYASDTLRIEIHRREQAKPARVWYEAEVFCAEGSAGPRMVANDPENWKKASSMDYPHKIARKNGTVLAIDRELIILQ